MSDYLKGLTILFKFILILKGSVLHFHQGIIMECWILHEGVRGLLRTVCLEPGFVGYCTGCKSHFCHPPICQLQTQVGNIDLIELLFLQILYYIITLILYYYSCRIESFSSG